MKAPLGDTVGDESLTSSILIESGDASLSPVDTASIQEDAVPPGRFSYGLPRLRSRPPRRGKSGNHGRMTGELSMGCSCSQHLALDHLLRRLVRCRIHPVDKLLLHPDVSAVVRFALITD
jgi:hypothetical protein